MDMGHKIRNLRIQQKLTLKKLGEKTGLTTSFLSQLERNLTSLSVSSLKKIAEALNTPETYLLEAEGHSEWIIIRKRKEAIGVSDKTKELFCEPLASGFFKKMRPQFFTIGSGVEITEELFYPEGEKFGMVLRGKLELAHSDEKIILEEGDNFYCDCKHRPMKMINIGKKKAKLLWVISPTFERRGNANR